MWRIGLVNRREFQLAVRAGASWRPSLERLEDRTLLSISLNGVPEWHEEGPGPIVGSPLVAGINDSENPTVGAIESVAVAANDADLVYIGSVTGGVWKTTNATDAAPSWTPLTDQLPSLSIGAVTRSTATPHDGVVMLIVGSHVPGVCRRSERQPQLLARRVKEFLREPFQRDRIVLVFVTNATRHRRHLAVIEKVLQGW